MHSVGWEEAKERFVDLEQRPIESFFKLYPWEWLLGERFGPHALESIGTVNWMEPIWKMMWSNKALLAILWELNPNHELLVPAYLDGPRSMKDYVRKPLFGREGAGITTFRNWAAEESGAEPVAEIRYVYQQLAPLATDGGRHAVIGSWLIDGEPSGMGMITTNTSRFVPHLFR
jgi:glutathionylspermidine synthase